MSLCPVFTGSGFAAKQLIPAVDDTVFLFFFYYCSASISNVRDQRNESSANILILLPFTKYFLVAAPARGAPKPLRLSCNR